MPRSNTLSAKLCATLLLASSGSLVQAVPTLSAGALSLTGGAATLTDILGSLTGLGGLFSGLTPTQAAPYTFLNQPDSSGFPAKNTQGPYSPQPSYYPGSTYNNECGCIQQYTQAPHTYNPSCDCTQHPTPAPTTYLKSCNCHVDVTHSPTPTATYYSSNCGCMVDSYGNQVGSSSSSSNGYTVIGGTVVSGSVTSATQTTSSSTNLLPMAGTLGALTGITLLAVFA